MSTWTLGLGGSDHDFSAALMFGSDIRVAVEQERLSRRKHGMCQWYEDPVGQAIDYCLKAESITLAEVDAIVAADTLPARVCDRFKAAIRTFPHHLCHAASAYMMLPATSRAGAIVYDGFGSIVGSVEDDARRNRRETFSFFKFGPEGYERLGGTTGRGYLEPDEFPLCVTNSVGMLYELVTGLIGYDVMESGKTMGLSSHGIPRYRELFNRFVRLGDRIDSCFHCATDDPRIGSEIASTLDDAGGGFAVKADLAATAQAIVNETLLHCERFVTGSDLKYLCVSGGCALNTVANTHLVTHSRSDIPIVIPPHCGDAGLGLGALWLDRLARERRSPEMTFRGTSLHSGLARPGRTYSRAEIREAVRQFYPRLALDATIDSAAGLARALSQGTIVGVLNGRSEIGPRALGGRSILADPRSIATRERLNRRIKRREPFRPFAPMVLRTDYETYFEDLRCADPFMLKVATVRDRCRREAPAVVHVDGTARVQVIDEDGDPFLIELLQNFHALTGVAVLLNTSFNRRGEPLVESPSDAVDAFLGMGLDALYLDGEFYRAAELVSPSDDNTPSAAS